MKRLNTTTVGDLLDFSLWASAFDLIAVKVQGGRRAAARADAQIADQQTFCVAINVQLSATHRLK